MWRYSDDVDSPREYNNEVTALDKYEYKVRADEIKALISEGEYAEAVSIADTIDWRRVKSVMMLCTISDLYKINRRYRESMDILLLAYEKHPTGRLIVYSLCELSIKLEEYVQAIEYYKIFVQIAPKDTGRYVLQYRLYEAQDVSLEERIAVLEEFKKRDYREKWGYELAYLYHRIGLATKCVEECDEMFLWFGEGKYIIKALELKALHEPLSEDQKSKYEKWIRERDGEEPSEEEDDVDDVPGDTQVAEQIRHTEEDGSDVQEVPTVPTMELPEVKTVDVGQYNTINLQMALAESMKEILAEDAQEPPEDVQEPEEVGGPVDEMHELEEDTEPADEIQEPEETVEPVYEMEDLEEAAEPVYEMEESEEAAGPVYEMEEPEEAAEPVYEMEEPEEAAESVYEMQEPEDFTEEVSEAAEPEEIGEEDEEEETDSLAVSLIAPLLEETVEMPAPEDVEEQIQRASVIQFPEQPAKEEEVDDVQVDDFPDEPEDIALFDAEQIVEQMEQEAQQAAAAADIRRAAGVNDDVLTPLNAKPSRYDKFLSQEYDGQISMVMPEAARIEKQITGQLSIDDIMAEWEEMKKSSEQRRMEEVRQRILAHTGNLFADFDEATKNGLLEELERAFLAAIMKDSDKKPAIKQVVLPDGNEKKSTVPSPVKSDIEAQTAYAEVDTDEDLPVDNAVEDLPDDDVLDGVEELEEIEELSVEELVDEEPDEKISNMAEPVEGAASEAESAENDTGSAEETVRESVQDRELTAEEQELFGQFTHHRRSKKQLVHTLDNMSLAACTGNVVITGEEEITTMTLAKALIKEMQNNDNNFSGKVAKISAHVLNKKDVEETFARLDNGALIIEKAARLKPITVSKMTKVLEKDNKGLLLIMIDKKQNINQLLAEHAVLNNNFNLRVDIEPLDDEALVAYAKQYAGEMEYSIDEFGILALHTRIADRQTSDHEVSMAEVRELVDEAIHYANKKTPKHFMDILLAKRYDEEDMIILRERDFMHY